MSAVDWIGVAALLSATMGLLAGLRRFQVARKPGPELVRKLFHICGGLLGLSLPWIFTSIVPVLLVCAAVAALFVALRLVPALRSGAGQVLLGVQRESVGEFCYVASFCLLFWLARGDKLLYSIPILIVALADAMAALIGQEYGKRPLHIAGATKSVEGLVTFFLVAFFCVHVPVLMWGGTPRAESLLVAVDVAAMVMMAEAAAWRGLDNLLIPLWGYMVLKSLLLMDWTQLAVHLVFLLSLSGFMVRMRDRTTLGDDALMGAVLWGYVVWAVGGWSWALAPLLQLAAASTVTRVVPLDALRPLRFPVVLANAAGSIPWLLAYRQTGELATYVPFAACFGANLAIGALVRAKFHEPGMRMLRAVSYCTALGMAIVLPSMLAVYRLSPMTAVGIASALISIPVAVVIFHYMEPRLAQLPFDYPRFARQAAAVAAASLVAFGSAQALLWALRPIDSPIRTRVSTPARVLAHRSSSSATAPSSNSSTTSEPPSSNHPLCAPFSTRAPGTKSCRTDPTVRAPTSTMAIVPKASESRHVIIRQFRAQKGTFQFRA